MGWAAGWGGVVALVALPPLANAQSPKDAQVDPCSKAIREASAAKFDDEAPFAGASIRYALAHDCSVIVLFRLTPKLTPRPPPTREQRLNPPKEAPQPETGTPHFYARVQNVPAFHVPGPVMWADQKTCGALLPAIKSLETAMTPTFTGDGPVRDDHISVTADGAGVDVWAKGHVYPIDSLTHEFEISYQTNLDTPTADWVETTLKQLKPCFSTAQPVPDPPIP